MKQMLVNLFKKLFGKEDGVKLAPPMPKIRAPRKPRSTAIKAPKKKTK